MTPAEARKKVASLPLRPAAFVESMECFAVSKLPDGPQWIYEIKLDGYRAQAVKSDTNLTLYSRRRKSFNRQFPNIVEALSELPENTVVDGEVLALDESGRPDFNLLQNFRAKASRIHYFVFDLLVYENRDLTRLQLVERRELLRLLVKFRSPRIRISDYVEASAADMLSAVRQQDLEGIIGKRKELQHSFSTSPGMATGTLMLVRNRSRRSAFAIRISVDTSKTIIMTKYYERNSSRDVNRRTKGIPHHQKIAAKAYRSNVQQPAAGTVLLRAATIRSRTECSSLYKLLRNGMLAP